MKLWTIIILLVLAAIVVAQNSATVTMRFLFWDFTVSRVVLFLLTLAVGIIVGFIGAKLPKGSLGKR